MANHYHVAVRMGAVPLWRTFGFVQARLGQGYNRRHRSTGPLWQSRFRARWVDDDAYLLKLIAYIHLNLVTAGLVDDPAEYALSGHRELLGRSKRALVDVETVLAAFGSSLRSARERYVRALEGAREAEWRTELPGRLPWWGREPDRPLAPKPPTAWIDEVGVSTGLERAKLEPREFLETACRVLGIAPADLADRGSGREVTRARCLVVAVGVERWRQGTKGLADLLGRRADVVSRWVRWGAERRQADDAFGRDYEALDRALDEQANDPGGSRSPG